jgi:hypothetical protein
LIKSVAAGVYHTVALKKDGTVVAWGSNDYGQTDVPTGLTGVTAIAAGDYHTVALKSDGTVVAWGNDGFGQSAVPAGLTGVTAIAAGSDHTVALKADGTLIAWGDDYFGQVTVPTGLTGVIAIAASYYNTVALKSDGKVTAWGYNSFGQTDVPQTLTGVSAISAGYYHAMALKKNGTVVTWGYDTDGQVTVPENLTGVIAIAAGYVHSVAVKGDGSVVTWGGNSSGQSTVPAGLTGVTAIDAGDYYTLALKSDGSLVGWGDNSYSQSTIPAALNAGGIAVNGALSYDDALRKVTFTPSALLIGNANYQARVSGINSQTGIQLAAPVLWSFKTSDLSITTAALLSGTTGTAYNQTLTASGGVAPYTWSIASGALPANLSLNPATGAITGTPITSGTFSITFRITDANSNVSVKALSITINAGLLTLYTASLPDGYITTPYSATLTAIGGTSPYSWSITSGALPDGLSLNAGTGAITGTPAVADSSSITFKVTDANSSIASKALNINIDGLSLIRVPGTMVRYYNLLQSAYDALSDGETIEMTGVDFIENLNFNRGVTFVLKGGYANDYSRIDSVTTIRGSMTISQGKVVVDGLVLRQ